MLPGCHPSILFSGPLPSGIQFGQPNPTFVPPECLPEAIDGSMREVFLRLCDHPIIIEQGNKSFWLDKWTGKKCYMLAARQLSIALFDSPTCWRWTSMEKSRNANTSILSPNTTYVAQLVFVTTSEAYGFEYQPAEVCIGPFGDNSQTRMVYLDLHARTRRRLLGPRGVGSSRRGVFVVPPPSEENCPKLREDGWFEVEIGEYFNKVGRR
ncbi:putative phloem protein [Helianthus annuus]|nr:putative phloem protein [Helianthus annuus]